MSTLRPLCDHLVPTPLESSLKPCHPARPGCTGRPKPPPWPACGWSSLIPPHPVWTPRPGCPGRPATTPDRTLQPPRLNVQIYRDITATTDFQLGRSQLSRLVLEGRGRCPPHVVGRPGHLPRPPWGQEEEVVADRSQRGRASMRAPRRGWSWEGVADQSQCRHKPRLRPPRGICEACLHQVHKPCASRAIPSQIYGNVWWWFP